MTKGEKSIVPDIRVEKTSYWYLFCIFSIVRGRVRHLPNIASGKFTGALLYQCRDWQDLVGTRNAIINVSIKTDPQFSGDCSQGHEGIPGMHAFLGVRAETDIPFANSLADSQFGYVVGYCCRFNGVSLHIHAHNQSIPDHLHGK